MSDRRPDLTAERAGDEKARGTDNQKAQHRTENDRRLRAAGRCFHFIYALLQQLTFLVVHLIENAAKIVHKLLPCPPTDNLGRLFEVTFPAQVDRLFKLSELRCNERLRFIDPFLLTWVI